VDPAGERFEWRRLRLAQWRQRRWKSDGRHSEVWRTQLPTLRSSIGWLGGSAARCVGLQQQKQKAKKSKKKEQRKTKSAQGLRAEDSESASVLEHVLPFSPDSIAACSVLASFGQLSSLRAVEHFLRVTLLSLWTTQLQQQSSRERINLLVRVRGKNRRSNNQPSRLDALKQCPRLVLLDAHRAAP
jgi:hypothetical protein